MNESQLKPNRKKPFSANNASRKALEKDGWTVGKVDQSINTGKFVFTRDLFGFADLLAMSPSRGVMLVQATAHTSTSNFHARVAKLRAEPNHAIALASGMRIQVHSWEGKGSQRECRILEITKTEPSDNSKTPIGPPRTDIAIFDCPCCGKSVGIRNKSYGVAVVRRHYHTANPTRECLFSRLTQTLPLKFSDQVRPTSEVRHSAGKTESVQKSKDL